MTTLIVMFNLKNPAAEAEYEAWARHTDLPVVRGMDSVNAFRSVRTHALLGSDGAPPYRYVEIIDINDFERFGAALAADDMQKVAAEFNRFAKDPVFMVGTDLESG